MVHVDVVNPSDVCSRYNLDPSLVVPGCERSNCGLDSFSVTEPVFKVSIMGIIGGMVALSKDPEPVPPHGVGRVVGELEERDLVGAVLHRPRRTIRELGGSEPVAMVGSSCTSVVSISVPRVHNPEAGRVDVGVQQGVGHPCEYGQVVLEGVVQFNSVFEEEGEAFHVEDNVPLNDHVVHAMKSASPVV